MSEVLRDLDVAAGLLGTTRAPGVNLPAYDIESWHKYLARIWDRLADVAVQAAPCEIFTDDGGALVFGIRPGLVIDGDTAYTHAGCTGNLTDDATNYILLDGDDLAAGDTVTVNQTGFPDPSTTPHIPLGTIIAADGAYTHDNISNLPRQRASLRLLAAMTAANANTLVAGAASNADALHVHAVAGLQAAVQDLMPTITLTGADDADGTGTMSIQIKDAAGNALAQRFRVRCWLGTADVGAPVADTDFSVTTGTELGEIVANADYEAISDATGLVVMNINVAVDGTYYVMAEVDGRIYSGSVAITGN